MKLFKEGPYTEGAVGSVSHYVKTINEHTHQAWEGSWVLDPDSWWEETAASALNMSTAFIIAKEVLDEDV